MLLSLENSRTSLFKEVRVFKAVSKGLLVAASKWCFESVGETKVQIPRPPLWAPPDLCFPRCVFRDCACIWTAKQGKTQNDKSTLFYPPHSPSLGTREKGRYTMYLPFSPYRFLGAKGADTLCICLFSLVPREGLTRYRQFLTTHQGKHRSGGAQPFHLDLHSGRIWLRNELQKHS